MIAVIFEFTPADGRFTDYKTLAEGLGEDVAKFDGFISIERFQSISRSRRASSRFPSGATRSRCAAGATCRSTARRRRRAAAASSAPTGCAYARCCATTAWTSAAKRHATAWRRTASAAHLPVRGRHLEGRGRASRRRRRGVAGLGRELDPPRARALALRGRAAPARRPAARHPQPLPDRALLARRAPRPTGARTTRCSARCAGASSSPETQFFPPIPARPRATAASSASSSATRGATACAARCWRKTS